MDIDIDMSKFFFLVSESQIQLLFGVLATLSQRQPAEPAQPAIQAGQIAINDDDREEEDYDALRLNLRLGTFGARVFRGEGGPENALLGTHLKGLEIVFAMTKKGKMMVLHSSKN